MKDLKVLVDRDIELNLSTDNYLIAWLDNNGDLVVHYDCLSNEILAKLYFALSNEINSRLSVKKI